MWQRYSSYEKCLRIVAYILRISPKSSGNRTETGANTHPVQLQSAEQKLFFLVQSEWFPKETKILLKSWPLSKPSIVIKDVSPFIGRNGLLRAQGWTKHLEIAIFDVKHPILLDRRYPAVRLFLEHLPQRHCHQGVECLRALIQQKFAIVKLRTTLKTIEPRFLTCVNRCGFLFTCLTTRAVQFEVVPSMDTCSCGMGVERFVSRRSIPSVIWSDNGTNFVAAEKELLQNILQWDHQWIAESLVNVRCQLDFQFS